jgi:hypothetical protein
MVQRFSSIEFNDFEPDFQFVGEWIWLNFFKTKKPQPLSKLWFFDF